MRARQDQACRSAQPRRRRTACADRKSRAQDRPPARPAMSRIGERRALRNGLKLPRLGFGGGTVFCTAPETEAAGLLDHAWALGFRYFDTAPFYGHGLSEHRFGSRLRERPRDEF